VVVPTWHRTGGKIVTKARAWQSAHVVGLAVDIALVTDSRGEWLDAEHPAWLALGREARKLGLHWGGDWRWRDCAHAEHPAWPDIAGDEIRRVREACHESEVKT